MSPGMFASLLLLLTEVRGHGWVSLPPARNAVAGDRNAYCPQCGNGGGICGDGNQWPSSSDYLNAYAGPQATWTAGSIAQLQVQITAHHKGHFEFSLCDQVISSSVQNPQACLDKWVLKRASPVEAGFADCLPADKRGGCQPIDPKHPERFYLPPPGFTPDGSNTQNIYLKVPSNFTCTACTLQWRWFSANSCIPATDYLCYYDVLAAAGYNAVDWGLNAFNAGCPGGGCTRCSCGEEFRNCVDIRVLSGGGASGMSTTAATSAGVTTTKTTSTSTSRAPLTECVAQSVLTCINGKSSYWPKCDPLQFKTVTGPAGYEFGFYCTQAWTDALNQMLSDPAVNKCHDQVLVHNLLAQVAYETGYFSTVYQPRDGGAGLIHMIPANWALNAQDMDAIFPSRNYASIQSAMGKDFFQSVDYGWNSVAAWFKRTNRVIQGCGLDLFNQSFDTQTYCIFGGPVDRMEAYNIVGSCMPSAPTTASSSRAGTTTTTTTKFMTTTTRGSLSTTLSAAAPSTSRAGATTATTATTKSVTRAVTTTTRKSLSTTLSGSGQICVPTPGLPPNGATNSECAKCGQGYPWWPCNTSPAICTCSSSVTIIP